MNNKTPVYQFVLDKARQRHIGMGQLAQRCCFSRTTLYRYLIGVNMLTSDSRKAIAKALELTETEEKDFEQIVLGCPGKYACAYPELYHLLFSSFEPTQAENVEIVFYWKDGKYLRPFSMTVDKLVRTARQRCARVSVYAVGCIEPLQAAMLQQICVGLFETCSDVHVDHLVSIPSNNPQAAVSALRSVVTLLRYQEYQALYADASKDDSVPKMAEDGMLLRMTYRMNDKETNEYFMFVFRQDELCKCLCHTSDLLFDFFLSDYNRLRQYYQKSLMYMQNVSSLSEKLAVFESQGAYCLYIRDMCFNFVPPEVYRGMFTRMSAKEKSGYVQNLFGKTVSHQETIEFYLNGMVENMVKRYKATSRHPSYLICCEQGIRDFAQTGRLSGVYANMICFSPDERKMIFTDLRRRQDDPQDQGKLIVLHQQLLPDGYVFSVNKTEGIIIDFGNETRCGICQNIYLQNQVLSEMLYEYAQSEVLPRYALSKAQTAALLEELIGQMDRILCEGGAR